MEDTKASESPAASLNLDAIKPGPLGKYSPLLYKWLKKNKHHSSVFQLMESRIDGSPTTPGIWHPIDIWIGSADEGWIHGNSLMEIICRRAKHGWALPIGNRYLDITDQFWAAYERKGRCAWDQKHSMYMIGDENRWIYSEDGKHRECQWCGEAFELEVQRIVEVKERKIWHPYRPSAPAA